MKEVTSQVPATTIQGPCLQGTSRLSGLSDWLRGSSSMHPLEGTQSCVHRAARRDVSPLGLQQALHQGIGSASLDVWILHTEDGGVELCSGRPVQGQRCAVWDAVNTGEGRKAGGARRGDSSTRVQKGMWVRGAPRAFIISLSGPGRALQRNSHWEKSLCQRPVVQVERVLLPSHTVNLPSRSPYYSLLSKWPFLYSEF